MMPTPAPIERETDASIWMPGSRSISPGADASMTESPIALTWSPVTVSGLGPGTGSSPLCTARGGVTTEAVGDAEAAGSCPGSSSACCPASTAVCPDVDPGATAIAAVVAPAASAKAARPPTAAKRPAGRPERRCRRPRKDARNPFRRTGVSIHR